MADSSTSGQRINARFLDANLENLIALAPLHGLASEPLVSLQEAVNPLVGLLDRVGTYTWAAIELSKTFPSELHTDQSAAIILYTIEWSLPHRSLYTVLNETLRNEDRQKLMPWRLYLKLLLTALCQLPSQKCTIFRGVNIDLGSQYAGIDSFTWSAFSSCTKSMEVLARNEFLKKSGPSTLFIIDCFNGKHIDRHSYFRNEHEVLLLPCAHFQVVGRLQREDGLAIIRLHEETSSHELLELPTEIPQVASFHQSLHATCQPTVETTTLTDEKFFLERLFNSFAYGFSRLGKVRRLKALQRDLTREVQELRQQVQQVNQEKQSLEETNREINERNQALATQTEQVNNLYQNLRVEVERETNDLQYFRSIAIQMMTRTRTLYIPSRANWTRNGISVAGGRKHENALDQLAFPNSLCLHPDGTMFIADFSNHRIIALNQNDINTARIVVGGSGPINSARHLIEPTDVLLDTVSDSLLICDGILNRRVMRWSLQEGTDQGEIILKDIACNGLAVDGDGNLYVSLRDRHEVRKYSRGNITLNQLVAGGRGNGALLNQLDDPRNIFVDNDGSVYVSDSKNHRVVKWLKEAKTGILVAGGQGKGKENTQLSEPRGLLVDSEGTVYVAEFGNDRVTRWHKEVKVGEVIAGGIRQGSNEDQLNGPTDLAFDHCGNLYVVDRGNSRVQRFDILPIH